MISVTIIDKGIPRKLKFGRNRNLDLITISSTKATCKENFEIARTILVRDGEIIESECERKEHILVLSTKQMTNIPQMISFPGKYFISFRYFPIQNIVLFLKLKNSFESIQTLNGKKEQ